MSKGYKFKLVLVPTILLGIAIFVAFFGGVGGYVNSAPVWEVTGRGADARILPEEYPAQASIRYVREDRRIIRIRVNVESVSVEVDTASKGVRVSAIPSMETRLQGPRFGNYYNAHSAIIFVPTQEKRAEWVKFLEEMPGKRYSHKEALNLND